MYKKAFVSLLYKEIIKVACCILFKIIACLCARINQNFHFKEKSLSTKKINVQNFTCTQTF